MVEAYQSHKSLFNWKKPVQEKKPDKGQNITPTHVSAKKQIAVENQNAKPTIVESSQMAKGVNKSYADIIRLQKTASNSAIAGGF